MVQTQIGLVDLGPMGLGLVKNLAEKGFEVFAWDEESQINANVSNTKNRKITVCQTLRALISSLKPSRTILLCIPSGSPVTDVLTQLTQHLSKNDVLQSAALNRAVSKGIQPLRSLTMDAIFSGIPCSGLVSSLAYVESKHGSQLPASLTQLQRNYFGQHPIYDKRTGEPIRVLWKR